MLNTCDIIIYFLKHGTSLRNNVQVQKHVQVLVNLVIIVPKMLQNYLKQH